jgi:hypothetical protein
VRYEKHRDKLTTDLSKLNSNQVALAAILGDVLLDTYVFMVPIWDDSALLEHAERRAAAIRSANLAFVDPAFRVVIHTGEDYPEERARLVQVGLQSISVQLPQVDLGDISLWSGAHSPLAETLRSKLDKLGLSLNQREELEGVLLGDYLGSEQMLERLRQDFPRVWHAIDKIKNDREVLLASTSALSSAVGVSRLNDVIDGYQAEIEAASPSLSHAQTELIALGTVADWLLRCPLNFPEAS